MLFRSLLSHTPGAISYVVIILSGTLLGLDRRLEMASLSLGASHLRTVLRVILPVGISFYTFEAINYTVDVYRRRVPAERNPAHLLFFVLFFPHLIAGPIVRARDFLPQIQRAKRWSWGRAQLGV